MLGSPGFGQSLAGTVGRICPTQNRRAARGLSSMLLKKLLFLALPMLVLYVRSRTAQNATKWLFKGVFPTDGPLGQVFSEFSKGPQTPPGRGAQAAPSQPPARQKRRLAATVANNWPVVLAFLAGICVATWLFSIVGARN